MTVETREPDTQALNELTEWIRDTQTPGPYYTWSDWWGMASLSLAVLYLMRGYRKGSVEMWLAEMLPPNDALEKSVRHIVAQYHEHEER